MTRALRARPDRAPLASLYARRNRRVSRPYGGKSSPQFRPRRPRRRHGPLSSLPAAPRVYVAGAVAVLLGAAPPPSGSRTRPPIPRTTHRTTSRTRLSQRVALIDPKPLTRQSIRDLLTEAV